MTTTECMTTKQLIPLATNSYSHSSSNVFVNAPYFDGLTHQIRGADGLPWWSPNQVLATICGVCSVEVCECVYCFAWCL